MNPEPPRPSRTDVYTDLPPERQTAYLEDPDRCPFCRSSDAFLDAVLDDGEGRGKACRTCGRSWLEIWAPVAVRTGIETCGECGGELQPGDAVTFNEELFHTRCHESDRVSAPTTAAGT